MEDDLLDHEEKQIEVGELSALECESLDFGDLLDSQEKMRSHYVQFALLDGEVVLSEGTVLLLIAGLTLIRILILQWFNL